MKPGEGFPMWHLTGPTECMARVQAALDALTALALGALRGRSGSCDRWSLIP